MKRIEQVLEDIQKAAVECGGCFIRQERLRKMTVEELLGTYLPNAVEFSIKYKPKLKHLQKVKLG